MPQFPPNFSARTVEPATGGSPQLPISGKDGLPAVITSSEMVATSSNANNGMMVFTIQVIEGEYKGSEGVYRLNLYHDNLKTVEIAWGQLSALCHVTGAIDATVSEQLYNRPFRVLTRLQKDAEAAAKGYTEVYGVLDIHGNKPGKSGSQTATAPTPAPTPAPTSAPANTGWSAPANTAPTPWDQSAGNAPVSTDPPWMKKP